MNIRETIRKFQQSWAIMILEFVILSGFIVGAIAFTLWGSIDPTKLWCCNVPWDNSYIPCPPACPLGYHMRPPFISVLLVVAATYMLLVGSVVFVILAVSYLKTRRTDKI